MIWKNLHDKVAIRGTLSPPGDKSIGHRAIILTSLAQGESQISNFSGGDDNLRTLRAFRKLGVKIHLPNPTTVIVRGRGLHSLKEPKEIINAGNSGTTIRLLTGLLAGQPFFSVITGDHSLRRRPMGRVTEPLRLMGAEIWGREGGKKAPLAIQGGKLRGIRYQMPVASAQVKSAILLAGLYAQDATEILEPPNQEGSRDHTERMLSAFGADIVFKPGQVRLLPPSKDFEAQNIQIPGDISAAAFFIVAALILPNSELEITNVGLNPGRTGILDALKQMGGKISVVPTGTVGGEPVGIIRVKSSPLKAANFSGRLIVRMLDEIPILAVASACAQGTTQIRDAAELRVKESDRLRAIAQELSRAGVNIKEYPDGLDIEGGKGLKITRFHSLGDHRIAMALTIASLIAGKGAEVQGTETVGISYPNFFADLKSLAKKD